MILWRKHKNKVCTLKDWKISIRKVSIDEVSFFPPKNDEIINELCNLILRGASLINLLKFTNGYKTLWDRKIPCGSIGVERIRIIYGHPEIGEIIEHGYRETKKKCQIKWATF